MLQLAFGVLWLVVSVALLIMKKEIEAHGQNVQMLLTASLLLAVYNFLRGGIAWFARRRLPEAEQDAVVPRCPRCGRPMRLVDLGPQRSSEKERWRFVCCGYQLQIDDDEELRRLIRRER